mgnify:FL=1
MRVGGHSLIAKVLLEHQSEESEVGDALLVLGVQMVSGVKPLAHDEALLGLETDLFFGEGSEEDEGDQGVEGNKLHPDRGESGLHEGGEVVLSDVHQVAGGVKAGEKDSGLPKTLGVVEAVYDGEVFLPLVFVHLCCYKLLLKPSITPIIITHSLFHTLN